MQSFEVISKCLVGPFLRSLRSKEATCRMVKELDFEAEKNQNKCKKIKYPTLFLCNLAIVLLEMGQNQQSPLKNQKKSTMNYTGLTFSVFDPFLAWKWQYGILQIKIGCLIFLHSFWFFSSSKSLFLTSKTSNTALPNILKYSRVRNKRTPLNKHSPWNIWQK